MGYKVNPNQDEVWVRAFIQAMANYQIRSPQALDQCVAVADKAVLLYKTMVRSRMEFKGGDADFGGGKYTE
jgi:hypothetical protein